MSKRIAVAASIWGASILGSRLIGLVREAVLGRTLGAGAEADAYWAAFVVPDFLNYLLAGGALSIVFIPLFGAHLVRRDEAGAWRSFRAVANAVGLGLVVLLALAWFALPSLAAVVAPGFDAAGRERLIELSRIVLFAQPFHVLGGLCAAALQARDRHGLAALAPLVYNLGIVAGGLLGGSAHGAEGFAWGVVAGSALGPFLLPLAGCLASGLRWTPRLEFAHPDLRAYLVRSLPIMLGFSIVVVDDWFLRREGSRLGAGAVSVLSYAKSLMRVPVGVVGLAASVAAYPTLVRLAGEGKRVELKRTLLAALRALVLLSFLAQVALVVAGPEIVALVYGRRQLTPERAQEIAAALSWISLGLAAWSAQTLLARAFYALGNTWLPALLGTGVALAAYPLYVWLGARSGVDGLALASTLAILIYALALGLALERRGLALEGQEPRELALFALKSVLLLGVGCAVGLGLRRVTPEATTLVGTLARATLLVLGASAACIALGLTIGLSELAGLLQRLRARTTRP
ncbi:MAG: murein biosynthesis integral membrane protein MurJ [Planctomycetes bacterium]|nr:murein biosynthesis integral membrane protein MurJ [Planctomycetota bacterium]